MLIRGKHRPEVLTIIDDMLETAGAPPLDKQPRMVRNKLEQCAEQLLAMNPTSALTDKRPASCPSYW